MKIPSSTTRLTLGELARRVGLARSSVLHYEFLGLLVPAGRSAAGYRLYGDAELERLRNIRQLRDAGLALSEIGILLSAQPSPAAGRRRMAAELLEQRLFGLCRELERIREQQRLLARLLALPGFRADRASCDKAAWVALLRSAGFDEAAMRLWHREFEHENPVGHETFLESLGLAPSEVADIRRWSRDGTAAADGGD